MALDLSSIIKGDILTALEGLLGVDASIEQVQSTTSTDLSSSEYAHIKATIDFKKAKSSTFDFYFPTGTATGYELLMLDGTNGPKKKIDRKVLNAINDIVSNIIESLVDSLNTQNFDRLGSAKFKISKKEVIKYSSIGSLKNIFKFDILVDDELSSFLLQFDNHFMRLTKNLTGEEIVSIPQQQYTDQTAVQYTNTNTPSLNNNKLKNLNHLMGVNFKLSVRLGTKTLLLQDITNWDTGTIIELDQMANEPLDILANGVKIGTGDAVIIDGSFGIKIRSIGNVLNLH